MKANRHALNAYKLMKWEMYWKNSGMLLVIQQGIYCLFFSPQHVNFARHT